tara:strand:- start:370 stop:921 length:552 start_codon:yes stop_codon:yes gene_type:complete
MKLVCFTVLLLLLLSLVCGYKRDNNSPASAMLPTGDYIEEVESLLSLDMILSHQSSFEDRLRIGRSLLISQTLSEGEKMKTNWGGCALSEEDVNTIEDMFGISLSSDEKEEGANSAGSGSGSDSGGKEGIERLVKTGECKCKAAELLLHDLVQNKQDPPLLSKETRMVSSNGYNYYHHHLISY